MRPLEIVLAGVNLLALLALAAPVRGAARRVRQICVPFPPQGGVAGAGKRFYLLTAPM